MAPRPRCQTCGSKQWHKEPSSGLVACSEGHVLRTYRNETSEITEVGPHAMKKRTLKSSRKKKEGVSKGDPKLYHGARARYHYFLCLQLILRKQVATLIRLWDLPPEFETICRDIWALNLTLLRNPPPAEPYYHAQAMREAGVREGDGESSTDAVKSESIPNTLREEDDSEGSATEHEEGNGKDESEGDTVIEALLREDSEISSSSSSSSSEREKELPTGKPSKKGKRRGHSGDESPIVTVGILVVACWTLRIPILLKDLTRLIESYELPYLDPAIRVLPMSMVQHLTKQKVQALSPRHAPETMKIHVAAARIGKKLWKTYGVYTPACNGASLLWRVTQQLGGNLLYGMAKRLASVLSVPLTLHRSLLKEDEEAKRYRHENVAPEVAFVACIIIALKLVYGLDGQKRVPTGAEDIGRAMPEWSEFVGEMKQMEDEDLEQKATRFSAKQQLNIGDMDDRELDNYIDFCSSALLRAEQETEHGAARFFGPVARYDGEEAEGPRQARQGRRGLRGREGEGEGEGGLRAGAEYKIWNGRDEDGESPEEYAYVVGRGAAVCGCAAGVLAVTMNGYERRLVQWAAGQRRRERGRRE